MLFIYIGQEGREGFAIDMEGGIFNRDELD